MMGKFEYKISKHNAERPTKTGIVRRTDALEGFLDDSGILEERGTWANGTESNFAIAQHEQSGSCDDNTASGSIGTAQPPAPTSKHDASMLQRENHRLRAEACCLENEAKLHSEFNRWMERQQYEAEVDRLRERLNKCTTNEAELRRLRLQLQRSKEALEIKRSLFVYTSQALAERDAELETLRPSLVQHEDELTSLRTILAQRLAEEVRFLVEQLSSGIAKMGEPIIPEDAVYLIDALVSRLGTVLSKEGVTDDMQDLELTLWRLSRTILGVDANGASRLSEKLVRLAEKL